MSHEKRGRMVPWFLWPFWAVGQLIRRVLRLAARVAGVLLGFVFVVVGIVVSLTIVGAIIGIPLAGLGVLLILRGLF